MDYVRLGRSNLRISRLGFGCMGIGDKRWRGWVLEGPEADAVLGRAMDQGINFFDTCDYYSSGRSEELLGRWMKQNQLRQELVIATKAGNPMGKGANARGYSRKHLFEAIDASLRRLGTDFVDLFQTHIWDASTDLEELVDALDGIVRAGKALYVGITDMPSWQFVSANNLQRVKGLARFVSVQNQYNAIWREDERDLMPFCRAENIGLVSYSPMARGFLAGGGRRGEMRPTERTRSDDFTQKVYGRSNDHAVAAVIESIAVHRGLEPAQVALAWVLSRPWRIAPVFGASAPAQVDSAVDALALTLAPEEISAISATYAPRPFAGS